MPLLLQSLPMNLEEIVEQLKAERERLDNAIAVLNGASGTQTTQNTGRPGPRKMSAAARARISAAQKKRWAAQKAGKKAA
jgi:hypothetical protein